MIFDFWRHPLSREVKSLDDLSTSQIHQKIIRDKPYLQQIYLHFYKMLVAPFKSEEVEKLKIIEIGAGAYNSKTLFSSIIATDIGAVNGVDMAMDAHEFPFKGQELDGILLLHTLHHIPQPELFFNEVNRCLKPGGYLTMIEPYPSPWGYYVYRFLHHEPLFNIQSWDIPQEESGRLSGANGLTPFHIFFRDRKLFEEKYPLLNIDSIQLHNCFLYITSGGLSYKSFVPSWLTKSMFVLEKLLTPFYRLLATSMIVIVQKVNVKT